MTGFLQWQSQSNKEVVTAATGQYPETKISSPKLIRRILELCSSLLRVCFKLHGHLIVSISILVN
jgi:hypothetical protein